MEELNDKLHMNLLNFRQAQWEKWVYERKPFSVLFELTSKCNMNCIHCYLRHLHSADQLSYEEIISILEILYDNGILFLVMTGGEILMRKDFLDIYLYAKKRGFLVELFSNGLLFSDDIIKVLQKYPPLYIDITLYGACEETYRRVTQVEGAFRRVIENCKKIKDAGINLSLRSPIIKETVNQMDEMKHIAEQLEAPFVCTFEICPTVDGDNSTQNHQVDLSTMLKYEFDDYFNQIKKGIRKAGTISDDVVENMKNRYIFSCNVGINSFVIDYKGNMCPCMKLKHCGKRLTESNFDALWEQFAIFSKMKSSEHYKCSKCDARYYCDVCPAQMDFMFENYEYRTPEMCKPAILRKAFYRREKTYEEVLD